MKKIYKRVGLIFCLISFNQINSQNYFNFNGAADVLFRYEPRGTGGRALVHDFGNILSLNYGGDFTGGVKVRGSKLIVDGNVGIGITSPDEKLAVNGNIHTKEVRVDLLGWSDFVFDKNYNLPSLKEVENHIKEKGHLKDIPSTKEVVENGIFLGDMNAKLLQKIEELTLYTIEQDKQLKSQEKTNQELKDRLLKLETLLLNNN